MQTKSVQCVTFLSGLVLVSIPQPAEHPGRPPIFQQ
jgi:hypothetical protein